MGIDTHVPRRPTQALALAIGYMLPRARVAPELGLPKVHHVDDIGHAPAGESDEEVVGLDITGSRSRDGQSSVQRIKG